MGLADNLLKKSAPLTDFSSPTSQEKEDAFKDSIPAIVDAPLEISEDSRGETEVERTARELASVKNGRLEKDIPLDDAYWSALKAHQAAYHNSKA